MTLKNDKPQITWDKIGPKTAIWCKTEAEARTFAHEAIARGYHWRLPVDDDYIYAGADTVYTLRPDESLIGWGDLQTAEERGYTIIPFLEIVGGD